MYFTSQTSTVVLELNDVIIQWTLLPLLTNSWHMFWSFVSYFLPLNGGTVTDNSKQRTTGKRHHSRCEGSDSTKGKLIHRSVWRKVIEWENCDLLMNRGILQNNKGSGFLVISYSFPYSWMRKTGGNNKETGCLIQLVNHATMQGNHSVVKTTNLFLQLKRLTFVRNFSGSSIMLVLS